MYIKIVKIMIRSTCTSVDCPALMSIKRHSSLGAGDAIHPVLREVGRSGDGETRDIVVSLIRLHGLKIERYKHTYCTVYVCILHQNL